MARKEKKYHFIYKTTNILSGRYYIGMHSTDDLEDGYLGSGNRLRLAIRKHGKESFKREILEFCKTREDLKKREIEVVNLDEISKKAGEIEREIDENKITPTNEDLERLQNELDKLMLLKKEQEGDNSEQDTNILEEVVETPQINRLVYSSRNAGDTTTDGI